MSSDGSFVLPDLDVRAFIDGVVTASVSVVDRAGNIGTPLTRTVLKATEPTSGSVVFLS